MHKHDTDTCELYHYQNWLVYLALPPIHCLLIKFFTDVKVDLGGAHTGRGFDVELLPILTDFHVWVWGGRHGHLPQHGVHPWAAERRKETQRSALDTHTDDVMTHYIQNIMKPRINVLLKHYILSRYWALTSLHDLHTWTQRMSPDSIKSGWSDRRAHFFFLKSEIILWTFGSYLCPVNSGHLLLLFDSFETVDPARLRPWHHFEAHCLTLQGHLAPRPARTCATE